MTALADAIRYFDASKAMDLKEHINEAAVFARQAQAAALIAIAERRQPQVVQVGSYAIRADAIAVIYHGRDSTTIFSETGAVLATLSGQELAAFLNWWNGYAAVVRLPQAPDPTAATAYNDDLS